jgi:hypothetical protein
MSIYSGQDFERIAETIAKSLAHVTGYAHRFEAAAAWYRLYCRAPKAVLLADTSNGPSGPMKLYTLYAPPNHRDAVVHATKADAEADKEHFDGKTTE